MIVFVGDLVVLVWASEPIFASKSSGDAVDVEHGEFACWTNAVVEGLVADGFRQAAGSFF